VVPDQSQGHVGQLEFDLGFTVVRVGVFRKKGERELEGLVSIWTVDVYPVVFIEFTDCATIRIFK